MTSMKDDFIEVPEPLFKYNPETRVVHDDNLAILSLHKADAILGRRDLRSLKKRLRSLEKELKGANAARLQSSYQRARQKLSSLKLEYTNNPDSFSKRKRWQVRQLRAYLADLRDRLQPLRASIRERNQIKQRITSHYAALDDKRKEAELQRGMAEEARLIAQQLTRTLARLGFKHVYTKGDRTKTDYVQWGYAIATPDQIQLKVAASKQGMWGGTRDLLPNGVFVTDIINEKVLNELSLAIEREVWSPHIGDENISLVNGAFIIVERLGLIEGIPRYVTYRQLMARYETANHNKLPIPAGLKRGRIINWIELDSPSGIHLMFTGISGSGKSNGMRAMISAVVEKQSPKDIVFTFVDLKKQGDFRDFEQAPHCLRLDDKGVLYEIDEVVTMLQRVRSEMHMRQKKIGHIANNLIDYNKRVQSEDKMPRIIIVFDEYANTRRSRFSEQADIIDDICIEIGQVGRAAGVSLWIGIQQPRRDNMPSSLRDNITTQFVGHQANVGAAQSATGNRDSLKLEDIPGRMAANVGWKSDKVQMPFITEDDVTNAIKTAVSAYGDIDSYQLYYDEGEMPETLTDEQVIIQTAFNELNGGLKIYPLHDLLKPHISRSKIKSIVEQIVSQGTIEYHGQMYCIEKQPGNYYMMIDADNSIDHGQISPMIPAVIS